MEIARFLFDSAAKDHLQHCLVAGRGGGIVARREGRGELGVLGGKCVVDLQGKLEKRLFEKGLSTSNA